MGVFFVIAVLGDALSNAIVSKVFFQQRSTNVSLEAQLTTTLQALQENSRQASDLTARLQTEIANRTKAMQEMETTIQELQQRRKLLDLTPEQQKAIHLLVQKERSLEELLTSKEFLIGSILAGLIINGLTGWIFYRLGKQSGNEISIARSED
jgi:hypothetical protein